MGEEGDTTAELRVQDREASVPELEHDPDAEEPDGGNLAEEDEEEEQEAGQHLCAREEHEVRAEDGSDRTARADVGDARVARVRELERDVGLNSGRDQPADQVPEQEADSSEGVLDVVPEDPEEEHVPADVQPASVHEHRGE